MARKLVTVCSNRHSTPRLHFPGPDNRKALGNLSFEDSSTFDREFPTKVRQAVRPQPPR